MTRSIAVMLMMLVTALLAGGCATEGYVMRGKVVHGPRSTVEVVTKDDPRLAGPGVAGASLRLTLDPLSLGRKPLGSSTSYTDGTFSIPVDEFGAGTLEYEVGVLVRAQGYNTAEDIFMLPGSNRRILVTMARGADRYRKQDDVMKELEPYLPEPLSK